MRTATFQVTMSGTTSRAVTVEYNAYGQAANLAGGYGAAVAGVDYFPASGVLTIQQNASQAVVISVRADDPTKRRSILTVTIQAGNAAVIVNGSGSVVIPGWVGLLDRVGIVDGTSSVFVPGLIGVVNG